MKLPKEVVVYSDGACRGNPGPASYGFVVKSVDGKTLFESGAKLGNQTNNFAEYKGLIEALRACAEAGCEVVTVRADSQFMIRQMLGVYKVKAEGIIPLQREAAKLATSFKTVRYEHVPREENKDADRLANEALDGIR